jgi:hypothetical protein
MERETHIGSKDKCNECGVVEQLVEHHISYEPEIFKILCLSCHLKFHKRNPDILRRPKGFKSKVNKWTSISLEREVRDRMEEYMEKRESWNKFIERMLDEIDYSRDIRKRYKLR